MALPNPDVANVQTRPARVDGKELDRRGLSLAFRGMTHDIAIVGEVRAMRDYVDRVTDDGGVPFSLDVIGA